MFLKNYKVSKYLLFCFLIYINFVFASSDKLFKSNNSNNNLCKQKDIVLSGDYHDDGYIHLKTKKDLNNLKILNIYGIDGLKVKSYDPIDNIQLVIDDVLKVKIDLDIPQGLSYLNISYTYQGKKKGTIENLIIPLGKISNEQKKNLDNSEVFTKKYLPLKNSSGEVLEIVPNSSIRVKRIRNAINSK